MYNADGTFTGELAYWVGARLARAHCALCDITHGRFRERPDWQDCRAGLPVPFATFHRNDQPDTVRDLLGPRLPAVVAETDQGLVLLLGPEELAVCDGLPNRLAHSLALAAERQHLAWA